MPPSPLPPPPTPRTFHSPHRNPILGRRFAGLELCPRLPRASSSPSAQSVLALRWPRPPKAVVFPFFFSLSHFLGVISLLPVPVFFLYFLSLFPDFLKGYFFSFRPCFFSFSLSFLLRYFPSFSSCVFFLFLSLLLLFFMFSFSSVPAWFCSLLYFPPFILFFISISNIHCSFGLHSLSYSNQVSWKSRLNLW